MTLGQSSRSMATAFVALAIACFAGPANAQEAPAVACAPERPTVVPRETIRLTAWSSDPALRPEWSATGGRIVGRGTDVSWDFSDVAPGAYTATAKAAGGSVQCSVRVIVMDPGDSRGVPRLSGRSLLEGNETAGYGLYTYLLFANGPDDASRERYKKAMEAYVSLMPDILALEKYAKRAELAITYAPVDAPAPKFVSADWILEHYDYARALVLLRAIPNAHRDGPYLVSTLTPLTGKESVSGAYLFQDLSTVPPSLASAWVKLFLNQASQERFWEPKTAALLGLQLRTAIGVMAMGLPDVQKSVHDWISWAH